MTPDQYAAGAFHAAPGRVACGACERCRRDDVWILEGVCRDCWRMAKRAREENQPRESDMRTIDTHKVNACNGALTIAALDEPGSGGANCRYQIGGYSRKQEVVADREAGETEIVDDVATDINFQNGPVAEVGVNGVTHEALLAILIDRLQGFQRGPFVCRENALALTKLEEALMWLNKRTQGRLARGVEGTHQK